MRSARAVVLAGAAGGLFTVAVAVLPAFPLGLRDPALHVAVEVTASWIALTAALLVFGRFHRSRRLRDLLLVVAFGLSGLTNLLLSAVPSILGEELGGSVATWGALAGRTASAIVFAVAATVPSHLRARRAAAVTAAWAVPAFVLGVAAVTTWMAGDLPEGVGIAVDTTVGTVPSLADVAVHPLLAGAQGLMALAYAWATYGFLRRGGREDGVADPLLPWLAGGAILAGLARLHYLLLPSLYADVVYSGDVLRIGFYGMLLVGVVAELRASWRAMPTEAAADERARIARDLHDGLAQELSFITAQSSWLLTRQPDEPRVRLLASASERALDESRRAIAVLAGTAPAELTAAVEQAVGDVADRFRQQVAVDVALTDEPPPELAEQLVRIVREAVANAARHAHAELVTVQVAGGPPLVLEVRDDGSGFDPAQADADNLRFGLRSMRERAEALEGTMTITSGSTGTTVRVEVPWPT
jgi:signal transduction histidine kinase